MASRSLPNPILRAVRTCLGPVIVLSVSTGCSPKNVRWEYQAEAPGRLAGAKRIALSGDEPIRALVTELAGELEFGGNSVAVIESADRAGADGADLLFHLTARYKREPLPNTRVNVWPWVSVKVAYGKPKGWQIFVSNARLDITCPTKGHVLGTVIARYDEPQEDLHKVAQKLAEGLEQIRRGKPPKRE